MAVPEAKGELLHDFLHFALGKIKLAGYKLSERDRQMAADDTIRELRKHGQWKELDDPVVVVRTWDPPQSR